MDPKLIARALGLSDEIEVTQEVIDARIASIIDDRSKLLTATGQESLDSALAVIAAGRQAIVSLETERKTAETKERDSILVQLRAENKVTPALETVFLPTLDLEGLRTFAKVAAPIAILGDSGIRESSTSHSSDVTSDEYEKLTNKQRADLKASDPETFEKLRKSWIARGRPTAK